MSLKDKVIVITGAASGMGLETAHLFASKGAKLSLADIQSKPFADLKPNSKLLAFTSSSEPLTLVNAQTSRPEAQLQWKSSGKSMGVRISRVFWVGKVASPALKTSKTTTGTS
jgi:NAD(P)-dependent dehydrogenase (short-subunit alcohol dehydrogenase family)